MADAPPPLTQRIVEVFLRGNLSVLLLVTSLIAGAIALRVTPREEEPQIVVPLADVLVSAPGLTAEQVERQVATRLEKLLSQIDGVEYVYSMSLPGRCVVTVRFLVGQDRENSLVKIYNKIESNRDQVPPDVTGWVVKPVEIDDVPIVIATLWSERPDQLSDHELRRIAEEVEIDLQGVTDTNLTRVVGGRPREVMVRLQPQALAARRTAPLDVVWALQVSNARRHAGAFDQRDREILVDAGVFVDGVTGLKNLVVNVIDATPVYLKDVAEIIDGPAEAVAYSWLAFGPAAGADAANDADPYRPAVHIAVAKKKGANAVRVAAAIEQRLEQLAATHLPEGCRYRITRNYGETADRKVDELVENLAVAVVIVIALLALSLGMREALIVAVAVPITFALTLLLNYLFGYTINRVTLFALTLALGLVVDDPIVDVENIHRHFAMRRESPYRAVLSAVNEVRPPIILATLAVIVSFLPLFFITGMMGPYMRPMALNVPLAMLMSMVVAFTITPWMSHRLLKRAGPVLGDGGDPAAHPVTGGAVYRIYAGMLAPFLRSRVLGVGALLITVLLLVGALSLAASRSVPLKMLPYDNKDELQVVIDMPEGTTLERTDAVARSFADLLRREPEVRDITLFAGLASPMDFNGLVRHYYLRAGGAVADLRVNLAPKRDREQQSHEISLRIRRPLQALAAQLGANIKIVESPPGPPVIATITGEIHGDAGVPYARLREAALATADRLRREPLVVDVDTTVEDPQERVEFRVDKEKAALSGVSTDDVATTLGLALDGFAATRMQIASEVHPLPISLRLSRADRSAPLGLGELYVRGRPGIVKARDAGGLIDAPMPMVQLAELGEFVRVPAEQTIYHKNLRPVVYVFGEVAGRAPAEAILDIDADRREADALSVEGATAAAPIPLDERSYLRLGGGDPWSLPTGTHVDWQGEGEWKITLDVFRDLGLAFAAACLGIYILLVYQTSSYLMPLILMISIPLTLLGILPGFWLLNRLSAHDIGGYPTPVFFTATAMIGMIALSGIAVRNAILLIDFVHQALARGEQLVAALLQSGAVRLRPILLTAATSLLAAWPITLDPIFSGLAWAMIFGLVVSTAFTLLLIPIAYHLAYARRPGFGLPASAAEDS